MSSPQTPLRETCLACLSKLTDLTQIFCLLEVRFVHELCFRLTCSLHSVHCSLLPEQGKSVEDFFSSEHSLIDLPCATSSHTDAVWQYTSVNIYNFNSRLAHVNALCMEHIRSLRTKIMVEYPVTSTSHGTYVRIEQTSEAIRVTYKIFKVVGHDDWNWEPLY